MCTVTFFQHKACQHMWAAVTQPCGPRMGFATCGSFGGGTAKAAPGVYRTRTRACPRCAGAAYDGNAVRLVERVGWGVKLGLGPGEDDWGVDVRFAGGCVVL